MLLGRKHVRPQHGVFVSKLNLVGSAGEYYVCAELCRQGILAVLTPKNNPIFDVIASAPDGKKSVTIQVKTRSIGNKLGWKLGANIAKSDGAKGQFVVLVNLHEKILPDFYVYQPEDFATRVTEVYNKYISKPKKDGNPRKDVAFRWFDEVSSDTDYHARRNDWSQIHNALKTAA